MKRDYTSEYVGETIRQLRESKSLSVRTLAEQSGFSPSFISQVEKGQASPSLHSLERIVSCLGLSLGGFFIWLDPPKSVITRASDRAQVTSEWSKAKVESLSPSVPDVPMEHLLVTLMVGGSGSKHPSPAATDEFVFVLEGDLGLTLNDEEFQLGAGDSVLIRAQQLRRLYNTSDAIVRVIIASARTTSIR